MVAWSGQYVVLMLAVLAKPTLGYHQTRRNPTARWVSRELRQQHRHVAGIRGGAVSRAGSTGDGLGGVGIDGGSCPPDSADLSSRTAADPTDRVCTYT